MITGLTSRNDLPSLFPANAIGVELGVASGKFSEQLLTKMASGILYSIDAWEGDRGHTIRQYAAALDRLAPFGDRSRVIRARFAEARELFDDASLDLVYIDGYAHQGNEAGQTLRDWWAKVKPRGGILAGHDYHPDWPKNIKAVDEFRAEKENAGEIAAFTLTEADRYPSWVMVRG